KIHFFLILNKKICNQPFHTGKLFIIRYYLGNNTCGIRFHPLPPFCFCPLLSFYRSAYQNANYFQHNLFLHSTLNYFTVSASTLGFFVSSAYVQPSYVISVSSAVKSRQIEQCTGGCTMRIYQAKDYNEMSRKAANIISAQVIMKPDAVLGLATGSS